MAVRQKSTVHGGGNIIIQNTGDHVNIVAGRAYLALTPPSARAPRGKINSDIDLLNPFRRAIALVGREQDLQNLRQWLNSDRRIAVRTLTGRGGAGKTRIALELIEELRAGGGDWRAGFVSADELRRFAEQQNLSQWGWQSPTLVVVDYAAGSTESLRVWLRELAEHPARGTDGPPLRLLLLEREANAEEGWYRSLIPRSWSGEGVAELFDPIVPLRLRPLDRAEERRAVLAAMLRVVADYKGIPPLPLPAPGENPHFDRQLVEPVWEDPLTLMMAALVSPHTGVIEALAFSRTDLAFRLAERELDRVRGFASPDAETARRLPAHLAAYTVLGGGLTQQDALDVAKEESDELGLQYPGGPGALVSRLHDALPAPKHGIATISPDIVAEALVLLALRELDDEQQLAVMRRAAHRMGRPVPVCLIRIAQDFANEGNAEPLNWLRALIEMGAADDIGLLREIERAMPDQTLALREMAAEVDRLLLERIAIIDADQETETITSERAAILNNFANRLSDLGRREEALATAEEAVRIRRQLAAVRPDAFLPELAGSLNNLATFLSNLGRREDALATAEEATELYRHLAAARPDAFLPDLAMSLNNLANRLSDLGRREDALATAETAVRIRRHLAAARPDAFLPDLAMSLNNLANCLSDLGRREDALATAEEAVRIRRQLAAARPDAFLPDLAMSLNNLANRLSDLGRREDALATAEEATALYRQLAAARPDAFLPDLAASLNNLANRLSDLGRREAALATAEAVVRIRRQLAAARPDAFLPELATSLGTNGRCLVELERYTEAANSFKEGILAMLPLFRQIPRACQEVMALLCQYYIQSAEKAGIEPDAEVLPVLERLASLAEGMEQAQDKQ